MFLLQWEIQVWTPDFVDVAASYHYGFRLILSQSHVLPRRVKRKGNCIILLRKKEEMLRKFSVGTDMQHKWGRGIFQPTV